MIGHDLDPAALAALTALADAIGSTPPPCWEDPDPWFDADPAPAVRACREHCHALDECAVLADLLDEDHGVWAGVDRGELQRRRKTERENQRRRRKAAA